MNPLARRAKRLVPFLLVAAFATSPGGVAPARAATLSVTLAELDAVLDTAAAADDGTGAAALRALAVRRLDGALAGADVALEGGALLYDESIASREVRDGCTQTLIRRLDVAVRLLGDTRVELELDSLDVPIRLSLTVAAELDARGRARQRLGVRIGSCQRLATDNFDVRASGPFTVRLDVSVALRPSFVGPSTLRFEPRVRVDGELLASDIEVDVDDSLLEGVIEKVLADAIEDAFSPERVARELAGLRVDLADALDAELDDGAVELELPAPDDARTARLYELLGPGRPLALTLAHLDDRRTEFLAALLVGDDDWLESLVGDAASCELYGLLQADLPHARVHSTASGACAVERLDGLGATPSRLYADPRCARGFDYSPTALADACLASFDGLRLGTPGQGPGSPGRWTLSPGTALDALAVPAAGTRQPFTTSERYRTVDTPGGRCELEMRVHVPLPGAAPPGRTPRRAVLAFHGGSWSARTVGSLGVEAMARHFTDAGFTVFQPFYRLIGDEEGLPACRNATLDELVDDANAALDWTRANAARFGAAGRPVVFGQSAGGQLAASLAVERPADVERAVLFYAPVDFGDFAASVRDGSYDYRTGLNILERVLGRPAVDVPPDDPLLLRHSLPARVARMARLPARVPPMFLLHGEMDELLPYRQSVRLCNALSGDAERGPAPLAPELVALRRVVACDARGSELHLIAEGEHALDACIADGLCPSGSLASADVVADSIRRMLAWAAGR